MAEAEVASGVSPHVHAQVMDVLREKLAAQVETSPAAVEAGHLVSGYLSEDPVSRHRFIVQLERAFSVPLDGNSLDAARTVGELAEAIGRAVQSREAGRAGGRRYVVCYRTASGGLVETQVRAANHGAAVESLRAEGLVEVVSIERDEEDEDDDPRAGRVHNAWSGCVLPLLAAFAVAGGAVAYFWWRKG